MDSLAKRRQHWSEHIRAWSDSELSQAEYCRHHQLDIRRFYAWKTRLGGELDQQERGQFLPVPVAESPRTAKSIVVSVRDVTIQYDEDTNDGLLLRLLAALEKSQ